MTNQLKMSGQEIHCPFFEDMRFHFSIPGDNEQAGSSSSTVGGGGSCHEYPTLESSSSPPVLRLDFPHLQASGGPVIQARQIQTL